MNKCPYCGFELKEGDVFCMNCGAALDEDLSTQTEPPKKKKHTVIWIILAAVIVILGGIAVFLLTRPELILARAARNTLTDLQSDEALSFIGETMEHGSVEVNMELGDLIAGFSLPLIDEIDARAGIKVYNDAENSEHLIKVTGSLGGSSALGADLWISPEHMIIKSPTFIGRESYGIDFTKEASRKEAETLLEDYLGISAEEYDEYADALAEGFEEKEEIYEKLLPRLYAEAFKTGDVKTQDCNYDFGRGDQKTKIIAMSFTEAQLRSLCTSLIEYAEKEEDLKDFAKKINYRWIEMMSRRLGKDFRLELKFFISSENRLTRIEAATEGNAALSSMIQLYDRDLKAAVSCDDVYGALQYTVGRNTNSDYRARLDYGCGSGEYTEGDPDISGGCDFSWDKEKGKWELYADGGFKASGELNYDRNARTATAVVKKIRSSDFTFEPNANIIVKAHDEMPEAPDYKTVTSQKDVDEFIEAVTQNVQSLISGFMSDYMGDMAGAMTGGLSETEDAQAEADAKAAGEAAKAAEEAAAKEAEEAAKAAEEAAKAEAEAAAKEAEEAAKAALGATVSETAASGATVSEDLSFTDKNAKEIKKTYGSGKNGASASSDQKNNTVSAASSDQKDDTVSTASADKADTDDTETVKKPDKPVTGTYYYDDGKKFSVDFKTGKYTEHVTVEAKLYPDGTYELTYSNGFLTYDDKGTYDRKANDDMTFSSSTGINATGKYYDDYIEVTIPGYITGQLKKTG